MSIDGTLGYTVIGNDRRTIGLNSSSNIPVNAGGAIAFTNGTSANQVNVLYQAVRTFSGSTDALNFTSGVLSDSYGTAVVLTAMKGIFIINNSASNTITFGAGTDPISTLLNSTGTMTLNPGAWVCVGDPTAAGWTVTTSTACYLNFSGTSGQSYSIVVYGLGT